MEAAIVVMQTAATGVVEAVAMGMGMVAWEMVGGQSSRRHQNGTRLYCTSDCTSRRLPCHCTLGMDTAVLVYAVLVTVLAVLACHAVA